MPKVKISRESMPDPTESEIEIYPDNDKSLPRIGVLRIEKGKSNLILDPGMLPYKEF